MRSCPVCGSKIKGRRDKVFCSAECKSSAQYERRMETEDFFFKVDSALKRNRKILKSMNKAGKAIVRKETFLDEGFDPHFFTHYWKNNKGQVYLFCYEFGFLETIDNNKVKFVLVKWQSYMEKK